MIRGQGGGSAPVLQTSQHVCNVRGSCACSRVLPGAGSRSPQSYCCLWGPGPLFLSTRVHGAAQPSPRACAKPKSPPADTQTTRPGPPCVGDLAAGLGTGNGFCASNKAFGWNVCLRLRGQSLDLKSAKSPRVCPLGAPAPGQFVPALRPKSTCFSRRVHAEQLGLSTCRPRPDEYTGGRGPSVQGRAFLSFPQTLQGKTQWFRDAFPPDMNNTISKHRTPNPPPRREKLCFCFKSFSDAEYRRMYFFVLSHVPPPWMIDRSIDRLVGYRAQPLVLCPFPAV